MAVSLNSNTTSQSSILTIQEQKEQCYGTKGRCKLHQFTCSPIAQVRIPNKNIFMYIKRFSNRLLLSSRTSTAQRFSTLLWNRNSSSLVTARYSCSNSIQFYNRAFTTHHSMNPLHGKQIGNSVLQMRRTENPIARETLNPVQLSIIELLNHASDVQDFEATRGNVIRLLMGTYSHVDGPVANQLLPFEAEFRNQERSYMMKSLAVLIRSGALETQPHPRTFTPVLVVNKSKFSRSKRSDDNVLLSTPPKQPPLKRTHLREITNSPSLKLSDFRSSPQTKEMFSSSLLQTQEKMNLSQQQTTKTLSSSQQTKERFSSSLLQQANETLSLSQQETNETLSLSQQETNETLSLSQQETNEKSNSSQQTTEKLTLSALLKPHQTKALPARALATHPSKKGEFTPAFSLSFLNVRAGNKRAGIPKSIGSSRNMSHQMDTARNSNNSSAVTLGSLTTKSRKSVAQMDSTNNKIRKKSNHNSSANDNCSNVELDADQRYLVDLVNNGKTVFFTGCAGTGKSLVLKTIIELLSKKKTHEGKVFVTAPTGIAACNIGGQTIHSFAGIGLGRESKEQLAEKILAKPFVKRRWSNAKVLIIDEVSMLDDKLFEKLEYIARKTRKNEKPFGGLQLILAGDFFQLPPVGLSRDNGQTGVQFCFKSPKWKLVVQENVVLKTVYRQKEGELVQLLNDLRKGIVSDHTIRRFKSEVGPVSTSTTKSKHVELGDEGHIGEIFSENGDDRLTDAIEYTRLYTKNVNVDRLNDKRLLETLATQQGLQQRNVQLPDAQLRKAFRRPNLTKKEVAEQIPTAPRRKQPKVYVAKDWSVHPSKSSVLKQGQLQDTINLGIGAQVMLLTNRMQDGLVNGSRGVVVGFQRMSHQSRINSQYSARFNSMIDVNEELPVVQFADVVLPNGQRRRRKPRLIGRVEQTVMEGDQCVALRAQVPLKLAWAMSIHKSQGMTIDRLMVDLTDTFEYGQAYVALSRASSLEGLQVVDFNRNCVKVHPDVIAFYNQLSKD